MPNFAECIAGKGKFCGRVAAASCAKNYGDRIYCHNNNYYIIIINTIIIIITYSTSTSGLLADVYFSRPSRWVYQLLVAEMLKIVTVRITFHTFLTI